MINPAYLLNDDNQFDVAEEAASRAIYFLPEKGEQVLVCKCHRVFGVKYRSEGETEKAIHHFEVALGIASLLNLHEPLFWIHYSLADLFHYEGRFDDAQAHTEQAKSHAVNGTYNLGRAMELQARVWYKQDRLEEARSGARRAADVFEKLGAAKYLEKCREYRRCFLRVFTSILGSRNRICIGFLKSILPRICPLAPSPFISFPPFTFSIHAPRFTFVVPPFVVAGLPCIVCSSVSLSVFHTQRQTIRPFECRHNLRTDGH